MVSRYSISLLTPPGNCSSDGGGEDPTSLESGQDDNRELLWDRANIIQGCFLPSGTGYECALASVVEVLMLGTLILAIIRAIVVLRAAGSSTWRSWKAIMMYHAVIITTCILLQFAFFSRLSSSYLSAIENYVQANMFLLVTYFFSVYALRVLGLTQLRRPVLLPLSILFEFLVLLLLVIEILFAHDSHIFFPTTSKSSSVCLDIPLVLTNSTQLFISIILFISSYIVTHTQHAKTSSKTVKGQKYQYMTIVALYAFSSLTLLCYQFANFFVFHSRTACLDFWYAHPFLDLCLMVVLCVLDNCIPVWVVLVVFSVVSNSFTGSTGNGLDSNNGASGVGNINGGATGSFKFRRSLPADTLIVNNEDPQQAMSQPLLPPGESIPIYTHHQMQLPHVPSSFHSSFKSPPHTPNRF